MSEARADPDELLRQVTAAERRARRGKLVIFFGAAPGVGKTYTMLEAARSERDLKRDVVVGIVESSRGRTLPVTYASYGGSSDTWSATWIPADIRAALECPSRRPMTGRPEMIGGTSMR